MSFFELEQNNIATLEETLEFIDSLDWGDSSLRRSASNTVSPSLSSNSSDIPSSSESCDSLTASNVTSPDAAKHQPMKRRGKSKRKRSTLSSSTRLQQRKKAELLYLRRRIQEMEECIKQLKAGGGGATRAQLPGVDSQSGESELIQLANAQYRARLQSEEANRTLKAILTDQIQVSDSLREILLKQACFQGVNLTCSPPPFLRSDFIALGNELSVMGELERKLKSLYLDSDSIFKPDLPPSVSNSTRITMDNNRNKELEVVSITPVACSMGAVNKIMIKELHNQRQYPDKWYQTTPTNEPARMQKKYVIVVRSQTEAKKLSGLHMCCKFEEANRTVYTAADVMVLTTPPLQFDIQTWIIVTRSASDPLNSSLVQICVRLSVSSMNELSACTEDVRDAQEMVISSMCTKYCQHSQCFQNRLIEETERVSVSTPSEEGVR